MGVQEGGGRRPTCDFHGKVRVRGVGSRMGSSRSRRMNCRMGSRMAVE